MFSRLKQKVQNDSLNILPTSNSNSSINKQEDQKTTLNQKKQSITSNEDTKSNNIETNSNDDYILCSNKETNRKQSNGDVFLNENETKVNEYELKLINYENLNQNLKNKIENLKDEINRINENREKIKCAYELLKFQFENLETENEDYKTENNDLKMKLSNLEIENFVIKNDKDQLLIKNAELSEKLELLKLVNSRQPIETNQIEQNKFAVNSNHDPMIKNLTDELNEKNKVIKNLQQRLNDIKKTLQKELKFQHLPNESAPKSTTEQNTQLNNELNLINDNKTSNETNKTKLINAKSNDYSQIISNTNTSRLNRIKSKSQSDPLMDDISFKYLKHVILKFLTSREYEAVHLIKALSVLLNLNKDEEQIIRDTLEWKMSWFGTKPKINTH